MSAKNPSRKKKRSPKRTPTTDPAQSARFLEMAKKLEVDESGEAFNRALSAAIQPSMPRVVSRKPGKKA
jgi:hypothetical protein